MPTHFEQAGIPVQREAEVNELKVCIERVFSPSLVKNFLKRLNRSRIPVRHFEQALAAGIFNKVDKKLTRSARELYQSLPVPDQSQVREFYLVRLEQVGDDLRSKFREIYYCN